MFDYLALLQGICYGFTGGSLMFLLFRYYYSRMIIHKDRIIGLGHFIDRYMGYAHASEGLRLFYCDNVFLLMNEQERKYVMRGIIQAQKLLRV